MSYTNSEYKGLLNWATAIRKAIERGDNPRR